MQKIKIKKQIFNSFFITFLFITFSGIYFIKNITKFIKRGVDLVGGAYITLDVAVEKVYQKVTAETLSNFLNTSLVGKLKPTNNKINDDSINLFYESEELAKKAFSEIKKNDSDMIFEFDGKNNIKGYIPKETKENIINNAIESNIKTLRKRLDPFGAGEILIARQGNRIVIELPNIQDKEQARRIIGKSAHLTIRPVIDSSFKKEDLKNRYEDSLMEDLVICPSEDEREWYILPSHSEITGDYLKDAHMGYNQETGNKPVVAFSFNSIGGKKFKELTKNNIGNRLAILIDDVVIMAPHVNEEIPGGTGVISSPTFTPQSAQELSMLLKSGSFAAPVIYAQERIIEPTLGYKTIQKGLYACAIGLILLLIASLIVYKVSGIFAFIVLIYNLLFSLVGMSLIGATLTLSGIAGLILTIGMAIDSSILIYEKIKEELAKGNSFEIALENGFNGAMMIIIDANVTHFLVATVLYYVGAGPIKGFAITMILGIIATIFSGIFLLRSIFRWVILRLGFKSIKI